MILKTNVKPTPSWDTIAFADIVVNLFVFFFITFGLYASFNAAQRGSLPIELPRTFGAATKSTAPVAVMIKRDGTLYLGSQKMLLSELHNSLNHELSLRTNKNVLVRADRLISMERFVAVLEVVRSTKAQAVAIETEKI